MDLRDMFKDAMKNGYSDEAYLIVIAELKTLRGLRLVIPNRQSLIEFFSLLNKDKYAVTDIAVLHGYKEYNDFMKELREDKDNKPDGLNFGDEN